jgi:hypothetical protein
MGVSYSQTLNEAQGIKTAADFAGAQDRWGQMVGALGDAGRILTTTPLTGGATYTQTGVDRLAPTGTDKPAFPVGQVRGLVWADQAGTLYLDESENNSTWTTTATISVSASTTTELPWTNLTKRYYRFRYVNGASAQTSFVLVQQAAGLAVPNVNLTGSTVTESQTASQAVPTRQAFKDVAMRAYENIVDIIGAENILMFVPGWETSGSVLKDLLNPDIQFDVVGATLGQTGLLHPVPNFDGVNDYCVQKAKTEATTHNAQVDLTSGTMKAAQKLVTLNCGLGFVNLYLIKTGAPSAQLKVDIVEDSAGVPGSTVVWSSNAKWTSDIDASTVWCIGFDRSAPAQLVRSKTYWLVLYYSSVTTVDASNYVSWRLDNAGAYGQPRATYDGVTWTVTSGQSHAFHLYGDELIVTDDASFVGVGKFGASNITQILMSMVGKQGDWTLLSVRYQYQYGVQSIWKDSAGNNLIVDSNRFSLNVHEVIASTFSKVNAAAKAKLYLNGKLENTADGIANNGLRQVQYPAAFSTYIGFIGPSSQWMQGPAGPWIWTKNELMATQVAKITNQLLALRRLQEAV